MKAKTSAIERDRINTRRLGLLRQPRPHELGRGRVAALALGADQLIAHFRLGVNGNVDGFTITGNFIHHVNNIAIDCIGFEGMAPAGALDQARNGLVTGNRIEDTSGAGNSYYGADPYGALGIYVDGGRDIVIERNTILRTDFGIEVSSEHLGRVASGIVVANNIIAESRTVGLSVGGWIEAWGGAEDVAIVNNTFYHNDTLQEGHGEIALLRHIDGIRFHNNIVAANAQGAFLLNEAPTGDAITADHNLYVSDDGDADGTWIWNGVELETLAAYRAASGNDAAALAAAPRFAGAENDDFRLQAGSPCIDAGSNEALPALIQVAHDGTDRTLDGDGRERRRRYRRLRVPGIDAVAPFRKPRSRTRVDPPALFIGDTHEA